MNRLLLTNIRDLLTMTGEDSNSIGHLEHKTLWIEDGKIHAILDEKASEVDRLKTGATLIDCSDYVVMPGYVDAHTHLVFGGSRVEEYADLLTHSVAEVRSRRDHFGIEASIISTVRATDEELMKDSLGKLERMLSSGTTTVEVKSGYGIDKVNELRMLRIIQQLKDKVDISILSTYLGAHYWDQEMGKEAYIDFMIREVMPVIEQEKLADFCDVWVDDGYYTAEEARKILKAGQRYGMRPTLHSECYSSIGGAKVASELSAANIGHLNYLVEEDVIRLAKAKVVGVVIPGTDFSVKHPKPFNPRPMITGGMELAIATNLNPGNWVESMNIAMSLACRNHGMTAEEALRASTIGGAKALGLEKSIGSIEKGKDADLQILSADHYKNPIYKLGVNEVKMVIKKGKIVISNE